MVIDKTLGFNTDKDKLIWTKIISIFPLDRNNSKSTHLVKYYKTEVSEEYYIFEYIMADNNGITINDFYEYHWREILKKIDFSDFCYIYSKNATAKDNFSLVTRGISVKKYMQEEYTRIYELRH